MVIEGLDGAGKRTVAAGLTASLRRLGARVCTLAFPRYDDDVHAELARDALYGRMGDLAGSVHAMAVLFALDRRAAIGEIEAATAAHDVVLVDRYVASNAAYSAARLHEDSGGEVVGWVRALEIDRFGLPLPAHQLLLAPPRAVAAARARSREAAEPGRARDAYESDDGLQSRTDAVYRGLAASEWLSPWTVLGDDPDTGSLADALLR